MPLPILEHGTGVGRGKLEMNIHFGQDHLKVDSKVSIKGLCSFFLDFIGDDVAVIVLIVAYPKFMRNENCAAST